ncbi:MAG: hypothetical protein ABI543_08590 [Ignavibacteria bacterium]
MRAVISLRIILMVFCFTMISTGIFSQDYKKPEPVNNETINMMLGKWEAEPYEMFGTKRGETENYYMDINNQFMFIDVNGKDETGFTYNALIVMKVNSDGTLTGYSFDDWGKIGTYTGTASGNKINVKGTKEMVADTREIEINGNKMTTKVTFSFKDKDGKDMFVSQTINYNKK